MNLRNKILIALAIAAVTAFVLITWRDFPPRLGLLSAVAVGALSFHAIGTATRLRRLHGRPKTGSAIEEQEDDA